MLNKHTILKSVDKKLIAEDINFVIVPSYITEYVDRYFKKEDLLCLKTLKKFLSKEQLGKFKHLNTYSCLFETFNDNYIESNPRMVDLLFQLPLYHEPYLSDSLNESPLTVGQPAPKGYFKKMEALIDNVDVNSMLKIFDSLAANYCQRFEIKEIKPNVYGIFLQELELIEAEELNTNSLDGLKATRFIEDLKHLVSLLDEKYPLDYVSSLKLFTVYSQAHSNVSEVWV